VPWRASVNAFEEYFRGTGRFGCTRIKIFSNVFWPPWCGRLSDATVGHVPLAVGDVVSAREFHVDRIGFETTAGFGTQALFVSARAYDHHIAMNASNSRGAGPHTRALWLGRVEIAAPTADDLGALGDRLAHFAIEARSHGRALSIRERWHNLIRVASAS